MSIMTSSFDDVLVTGKKYILSGLSLSRVVGLQARSAAVVKRAIEITKQDFIVIKSVHSKQQYFLNYSN